jgi:diacylglycerol kinase family enzyme
MRPFLRCTNVRVVVCGGDGTIAWAMKEIDSLKGLASRPVIVGIPLGTGE